MPREDFLNRESGHRKGDIDTGLSDEKNLAPSSGQDVRRVLDELAIVADDDQGAIPKEVVRDRFIIELPSVSSGQHGVSDTENQDRMFQLRKEFLKADPEGVYAWVPQAVEAYRRAQKSDLLPDLGVICAIGVNVDTDAVKIMTRSTEAGTVRFDLKLSELASYSLELMLGEAEKKLPVPAFHYSGEMEAAIGSLSPSAQLRWELITRAAYLEARGNDKFAAKPVSSSRSVLDGKLEGVGVFLKDRSRFSLVKVIDQDVPMTPHEQELISQISNLPNIHRDDTPVKALLDLSDGLFYFLRDFSEAQGTVSYLRDRLRGAFGKDNSVSVFNELSDLYVESETVKRDAQNVTIGVLEEILEAKVTFSDDNPFELTKLSEPMVAKLNDILTRYVQILEKIQAFIAKKKSALNEAVSGYNYQPKTKDNARLPADLIAERDQYDAQQHAETKGQLTTGLEKIGESSIAFEAVIRGALTDGQDK